MPGALPIELHTQGRCDPARLCCPETGIEPHGVVGARYDSPSPVAFTIGYLIRGSVSVLEETITRGVQPVECHFEQKQHEQSPDRIEQEQ